MNTPLICVLGFIGSGKGAVSDIIVQEYGYTKDSFAASLKDVCSTVFSWPRHLLEGDTDESRAWREIPDEWWANELGINNLSPRMVLQNIGTEVFRHHFHSDIWMLSMKRRILDRQHVSGTVISDCRFANEIAFARALGGKLILVDNGIRPEWHSTAAEACSGDIKAIDVMLTQYKHIHRSEWEWANAKPDVVIDNALTERTPETYKQLINKVKIAISAIKEQQDENLYQSNFSTIDANTGQLCTSEPS